jgi:nucleoid-associated protein YgaU
VERTISKEEEPMPIDEEKREQSGLEEKKETKEIVDKYVRGAVPEKKVIAEHTVKEGDTLGQIALQYYGSAAEEKWMAIYNFNKFVIGDNPSLIKTGQVLKIPEL